MDAARSIEGNPSEPDIPRLSLRPREAAQALGICERTLWGMTRAGDIPHFKLGKSTLYPVEALREWLRERVREGSTRTI